MFTEVPSQQYAETLDQCVREILTEAGYFGPPVDAFQLARHYGLAVARDAQMGVRARFLWVGQPGRARRGTIMLADDPRPERRQWAVAHEIGECFAERFFALLSMDSPDITPHLRERVANQLAGALLLPKDWFEADGQHVNWDVYRLKCLYRTASHELIARRMLEMPGPVVITMFDQGKLLWRRSNALRQIPRIQAAENTTWQRTNQRGVPSRYSAHDLPDFVSDIRCWPVHEPGWKREIMRTELEL